MGKESHRNYQADKVTQNLEGYELLINSNGKTNATMEPVIPQYQNIYIKDSDIAVKLSFDREYYS